MRPHKSLDTPGNTTELIDRLLRLTPEAPRQWGTLTPHEMLRHVVDSFLGVMGERHISSVDTWWSRHVMKWLALHTWLP